ncbi:Probable ABC transporter ATP-binding protein HI_0664 [Brevundimonas diminuta]|uniref:Probable ABC transporter ATP-binding protein HI_0664 n=1 Tax=Brevundimonas diminuta TaxID=293 RepID=A0A2X1CIA4_BREDI|nr:Probable ABC transporter ATP-binding protein HI_0664 [Brevundimonas diminuta]
MVMASLAGWRAAVAVALAAVVSVALGVLMGRRLAEPAGRALQEAMGDFKTDFAAMAAAAPELQAYGMKDWAVDRLARQGGAVEAAAEALARAGGWLMAGQTLAMALGVTGAALAAGTASPALTALAMLAAVATIESAGNLLNALRQNGAVAVAVQRLGELLDGEAPLAAPAAAAPTLRLSSADLRLTPPQRLAVVGRSGAGKTTLIERMMHLRAPIPGEVAFADMDGAALSPDAVRPLFAYAPQQAVLMAGTVRENLRLAAPRRMTTSSGPCWKTPDWLTASAPRPAAWTRLWAKTAHGCQAASGGAWAWPAPICVPPPGWCWTSRPKAWTPPLRPRCWTGCRSASNARVKA